MNIRDLKIFLDIAQERNFVKAAFRNYLTQPSVSTRLKHLEEELGLKLFERIPRKVSLTREGELLLPHAEELIRKYENLKSFAGRLKNVHTGDVRIATVHTIGIYELTPILKKFMRAFPDIQIHLHYRHARTIYELVLKKEIDLGLVAYPQAHHRIQITPFAKDILVVIVPPHHRFAGRKSIALENIRGEKFIAFDPSVPTRRAIDEVLAQKKISVAVRAINENIDTLKRSVEVGLGISIVPSKTVADEVQKGTLRMLKIRDAKLERPLGILTLEGTALGEASRLFMNALLENGSANPSIARGKKRLVKT